MKLSVEKKEVQSRKPTGRLWHVATRIQGTTASWWHPDRAYVRVVPSVRAKAIPSKTTQPLINDYKDKYVDDGERVA